MINIKSEVLQETNSNYIYDTKVSLEGTIDSLLVEASTALCKLVEVMIDNLEEDVSEDTLLEVKQILLKSIYTLSKDILIKGEDINI